jgi:thiamine kinase-like enzyme
MRRRGMDDDAIAKAGRLSCWSGPVDPEPVVGGITNANFVVRDRGESFFVRIGDDIPVHGIWRWNELAASRAAHAAGISPQVVHAEPGAIVLRFIEGRTLTAEDLRGHRDTLARAIRLVRRCHREIGTHHEGPAVLFWVFQVLRSYVATLRRARSRHSPALDRLETIAAELEAVVGEIEITFGHNDLLAANFIDDGDRLWLVDWDYAGFNSPLFDLGGLASNNELDQDEEHWMLEAYFEAPTSDALWQRYSAMKCASLLRETMWSMVSELHSTVDFDYAAYTERNLTRFEREYAAFRRM